MNRCKHKTPFYIISLFASNTLSLGSFTPHPYNQNNTIQFEAFSLNQLINRLILPVIIIKDSVEELPFSIHVQRKCPFCSPVFILNSKRKYWCINSDASLIKSIISCICILMGLASFRKISFFSPIFAWVIRPGLTSSFIVFIIQAVNQPQLVIDYLFLLSAKTISLKRLASRSQPNGTFCLHIRTSSTG